MSWSRGASPTLVNPSARLVGYDEPRGNMLWVGGRSVKAWGGPVAALEWLETSWDERELPRDQVWTGYLGYDLGRQFESLPAAARELTGTPLFAFGMPPDGPPTRPVLKQEPPPSLCVPRSLTPRTGYLRSVERALGYVRAGDVFQVNLAQMFVAAAHDAPADVWRRLRDRAPGAYDAYLDFGDVALVSNSPELFFRVDVLPDGRRRIVNRPIKGTRPRLPGMDVELLRSAKDQAELTMIVDLQRNDLGRICEVGSVRVTEPRAIEAHPTVYHGAATIEGILRPDVGFVDILRAVFPCGSVTGCPKIRAMQIIDELEPVRRGPYCGAIGWVAADGSMEFNVAIRTMVFTNGLVYIPVGGGIVADSVPEAEYDETIVKAKAMLDALGLSAHDLRD